MDVTSLATGGGTAGIILAIAYLGRLALDWRRDRRTAPTAEATASVTDAVAANAVLVQSLDAVQSENRRMAAKIKHLEEEDAAKDRKIDELRSALAEAQQQIQAIASELDALKTRP